MVSNESMAPKSRFISILFVGVFLNGGLTVGPVDHFDAIATA